MNEAAFVTQREPDWIRLTHLCDRGDASVAYLSTDEFHELIRLYRKASADLATIRSRSSNIELAEFLNALVGRAYGLIYQAPRSGIGTAIKNAIAVSAQTFRRRFAFIFASFLIFALSGVLSFYSLRYAPQTRQVLIPPETAALFQSWQEGKHDMRTGSEAAMMTGFYMSNNPRVAIIAGSVAASTFGLGTAYLLYSNGLLIGSLNHEMAAVGKTWFLWSSILPHGVPELTGIFVSGGAGLVLGWALIHPGRKKRGAALKEAGKDAIVLLLTAYILMFIAAPIEGYFSFNPAVPQEIKFILAIVTAGLWAAFWIGYGRTPSPSPPQRPHSKAYPTEAISEES